MVPMNIKKHNMYMFLLYNVSAENKIQICYFPIKILKVCKFIVIIDGLIIQVVLSISPINISSFDCIYIYI